MRQEKKKAERKRAELLAPAGSEQAFVAAIENGADAVYVGGRSFNARMNAGNFDDEAMRSAIAWAHLRGADVHVTMNTLLRDEEILPAVRYAGFLYEAGADALIVQDFGLAGVLTRELPDLPLHLSTQATAYDAACVRAAEQLGFRRAVLSRELSYQQIREITAGTDMEIETFVHGALCVCYSGQCQLSRYIGGRSGNRGACAQPCRLPWETAGAGAPKYALSPRDLCLLGDLPALIECGVRSFKIEGRMKSPEYVAVVTRIYRKYIDLYYSGAPYAVDPADREELTQIFSRGGFTRGFFGGEPGKGFLAGDVPKHEGLRVGTVVARPKQKESGAGGRGRGRREEAGPTLVDVRADRPIETGDGVEIHPADGRAAASCGSAISGERCGRGTWCTGPLPGRSCWRRGRPLPEKAFLSRSRTAGSRCGSGSLLRRAAGCESWRKPGAARQKCRAVRILQTRRKQRKGGSARRCRRPAGRLFGRLPSTIRGRRNWRSGCPNATGCAGRCWTG